MLRHTDGREAVLTHAKAHLDVGLGWVRHGVGQLVSGGVSRDGAARPPFLIGIHEQLVFVPSHLTLAHPERGYLNFVLRAFVRLASRLRVWTAHHKLAAGNRHHGEAHARAGNRVGVSLHVSLGCFGLLGRNPGANVRDGDVVVVRQRCQAAELAGNIPRPFGFVDLVARRELAAGRL